MTTPAQRKLAELRLAEVRKAKQKRVRWFKWTGFAGKTFWDWLQLLIIPLVLASATIGFGLWQAHLADMQHQQDQAIALDQQRATILQTYIDNIQDLLLNHNLLKSSVLDPSNPYYDVAILARARTLTALQGLQGDPERKGHLLIFLHEAELIGFDDYKGKTHGIPIIVLSGADLSEADLHGANLSGAFLEGANLSRADLSEAFLKDAVADNLSNANLSNADLSNANLSYGNPRGGGIVERADLSNAKLSNADLSGANLSYANLSNANLSNANLSSANLSGAILSGADLHAADLLLTDLSDTRFSANTNLRGAYLSPKHPSGAWPGFQILSEMPYLGATHLYPNGLVGADLHGADLIGADLAGADLHNAILIGTDLAGANLSNAHLSNAHLSCNITQAQTQGTIEMITTCADLDGANLQGADLSGADLSGAFLDGADLSHANLSYAQNLTQQQLDQAGFCTGAILLQGLICHHVVHE